MNALKNRRYSKSTFSAGAHSPMIDWMDWCSSRIPRAPPVSRYVCKAEYHI